jgi:hypothetical protein
MKFTYAIQFVADMDRAVAFYRDTLREPSSSDSVSPISRSSTSR